MMPLKDPIKAKEYKKVWYLKNRDKQIANHKKWNKKNKHRQRGYDLRKKYKLREEDYRKLHDLQSGMCAICNNKTEKKLCMDHDHFSKKVRGLLCHSCNLGLGSFRDNPVLLRKSISYLEGKCPVDLLIS